MLKRNITYINPFTEHEVTEEHYFHLSKADMAEMEMGEHKTKYTYKDDAGNDVELTGMQAKLKRIIDAEDGNAILSEFKDMIRRSYGKKVGERFVKNQEIWEEFSSSEAYSQLLFELCTDAQKGAEFFNGILPANLVEEAARLSQQDAPTIAAVEKLVGGEFTENGGALTPEQTDNVRTLQRDNLPQEPRVLTAAELEDIDPEELKAGLANGKYKFA